MKEQIRYEKQSLGRIEQCYSALGMNIDGIPYLLYGGEGPGCVRAYHGERFEHCDVIWVGGGGTMSLVPLPGHEGWALASRGFYSMVDSEGSSIEIIRYRGETFTHEEIARLPYLHRFDTVAAPDGTRYIVAATLHSGKKDTADWSTPGHVFAGILPDDLEGSFRVELEQLPGDHYMNHGFCRGQWEGREAAFIAAKEGVFVFLPPETRGGEWTRRQLMDIPVSDIVVCDIDGDGEKEIAAILPFHGDQFKIFRKAADGYREVFSYPVKNDFYHAVISGSINGETMFAGGARKLTADTFLVRWDDVKKEFFTQQLDTGSGPSNLAILNSARGDFLLSADRMISEAAVYRF